MELDVEAFRGAVEEVEHALEWVRERGGGVLHPRGLHDATATPRLVGAGPARGAHEAERHEWGAERPGEDDSDRRRRNARELARYADRQPVSTDRFGRRPQDGGRDGPESGNDQRRSHA